MTRALVGRDSRFHQPCDSWQQVCATRCSDGLGLAGVQAPACSFGGVCESMADSGCSRRMLGEPAMAASERSSRVVEPAVTIPVVSVPPTRAEVPPNYTATLSQPSWITPVVGSSQVGSPSRLVYRDVSPDRVFYRDSSAISPALRSWIECLVDNRIDAAMRQLQETRLWVLLFCLGDQPKQEHPNEHPILEGLFT